MDPDELKKYRLLFATFAAIFLVSGIALSVIHWQRVQTIRSNDAAQQIQCLNTLAKQVNRQLQQILDAADDAVKLASEVDKDLATLEERLKLALKLHGNLKSTSFAFGPFLYDDTRHLVARRFQMEEGTVTSSDLDQERDYISLPTAWYDMAMEHGPVWLPPELIDHQQVSVRYCLPFTWNGREKAGVLVFEVLASHFAGLARELPMLAHQYMFLLDVQDRFLVHPNPDFLGHVQGEDLGPKHQMPASMPKAKLLTEPLLIDGWEVGIAGAERPFIETEIDRKSFMLISAFFILSFILIAAVWFCYSEYLTPKLWTLSHLTSILFFFGTIVVLVAVMQVNPSDQNREVTSFTELDLFMDDVNRETLHARSELPLYVPTGIYIQALDFVGPAKIHVSGYLWQRYHLDLHDHVEPGFILPEAVDLEVNKAYEQVVGHDRVVGWHFEGDLSQNMDYTLYPFGREQLKIQIWHKEFYRNVVLLPDLGSYKETDERTFPGLMKDLSPQGWDTIRSWFSYRNQDYPTHFGLNDYSGLTNFPELFFNVEIRKEIFGPFVTHLFPILVIVVLLYTILMLTLRHEKQSDLLGYNAMNVVATCAGFFLAVIFSHIGLRQELEARNIVYLEFYYFITYALILGMAVNAKVFSTGRPAWILYEDNFIIKVIFWPLCTGLAFWLTCLSFY